mmetsp:Transcript_66250/g.98168  ORF Transcript_66250/g.98168 Transcript_66250/m.98168 type:complete len:206 (-) Transcript_66250:193-810(-)
MEVAVSSMGPRTMAFMSSFVGLFMNSFLGVFDLGVGDVQGPLALGDLFEIGVCFGVFVAAAGVFGSSFSPFVSLVEENFEAENFAMGEREDFFLWGETEKNAARVGCCLEEVGVLAGAGLFVDLAGLLRDCGAILFAGVLLSAALLVGVFRPFFGVFLSLGVGFGFDILPLDCLFFFFEGVAVGAVVVAVFDLFSLPPLESDFSG